MKKIAILFLCVGLMLNVSASRLLVPMDPAQKNHLKAYGIAYWVLKQDLDVDWLLNYRDGSFMLPHNDVIEKECRIRGVSFEVISEAEVGLILVEIAKPDVNMELVKLHKAPKIAVYSPKTKLPWDDAVTMVLTYAEIPYETVFDDEVIAGKLPTYDWLHLHHEDFTGQYGKFWASFQNTAWYQAEVRENEAMAAKHGFKKVSELKLAVAKKIRDFVSGGGFLFAMCSATDSYDIALSADGVDICESMFDGDPADMNADSKLNYQNTFAFKDYKLKMNPYEYEYSYIDNTPDTRPISEQNDVFTLFDFSAKWDVVPTMLCQNHTKVIKGFYGQTTAFRKQFIKSDVLIMGETKTLGEARYIHGTAGKGTWTFYGGHDPEDYQHQVGEPPTDLNLHPNSPGYRLILNNILFPSAKKKKMKT
ncbi:MAG: asparagine synthetase B [Bacteroidia bacterium]|nr:asparagine synthetase B [Bacteroidia bacterium]MBP9689251.1 asparagine synthetase B [Bacteroidia bacterium]